MVLTAETLLKITTAVAQTLVAKGPQNVGPALNYRTATQVGISCFSSVLFNLKYFTTLADVHANTCIKTFTFSKYVLNGFQICTKNRIFIWRAAIR